MRRWSPEGRVAGTGRAGADRPACSACDRAHQRGCDVAAVDDAGSVVDVAMAADAVVFAGGGAARMGGVGGLTALPVLATTRRRLPPPRKRGGLAPSGRHGGYGGGHGGPGVWRRWRRWRRSGYGVEASAAVDAAAPEAVRVRVVLAAVPTSGWSDERPGRSVR